ncbi:hypothetical protein MBAV_003814 [Candidatus Magnetobacterium bavaricum]|uniref:Uncharacterized protein n=1 Tax=Candidatus Magnetobacterium bavaricum TaxID=29290 RepID=A0A0F3GQA1_9BACT|nr:hypothetical protein MBAV_003814 [Candidatus Magnetobacterium bavaricum]
MSMEQNTPIIEPSTRIMAMKNSLTFSFIVFHEINRHRIAVRADSITISTLIPSIPT